MTDCQRMIIDTDTASDDAVAIIMALQHPDVVVEAITIVSGNVPMKQGSINARYAVELCGHQTPVYEGCAQPLIREIAHADWFHGPDGMGDMNYPAPQRPAASGNAVNELLRRFSGTPGEITLVTLGPLTNIATALSINPDFAKWVKRCYVMGGAANIVGNVTPAAEYNIWCDPEAARIVFHSGMDVMMVGWEHSRSEATLSDDEIADIYAFGTERARFAMDCNVHALKAIREIQGENGMGLPDPVTMAIAIDPSVCTYSSRHYVDVACETELTRGMTVVDQLNVTGKLPNVEVCWSIDFAKWKESLYRSLKQKTA